MTTKKSEFKYAVVAASELGIDQGAASVSCPVNFAICVRAHLQNWRQGTVGCKDRSEVAYANRKQWKQKGTGRARAGSKRNPVWVGGGVTFGPQPRTRSLTATREMKRQALSSLLYSKVEQGKIIAVDFALSADKPSTKQAHEALMHMQLQHKKTTLFVMPQDRLVYASFANIPSVKILLFDQPNVYDLANGDCWLFLKKDEDRFKEMVSAWI